MPGSSVERLTSALKKTLLTDRATDSPIFLLLPSLSEADPSEVVVVPLDLIDEVERLLHALDGRYVPPGPGNDPVRNPAAIPTGRNMYALDPESIPSAPALEVARAIADQHADAADDGGAAHDVRLAIAVDIAR